MTITLGAPLEGWAAPLSEVPDPVFADRMLGDGVAIHPTAGSVRAPCDAVVLTLHDAGHAITLRCADGVELLIHIGLETVALGGEGFSPRVAVGDAVARGDVLIDFDLDRVAGRAKSLITPVIITNGDMFRTIDRTKDKSVGFGDTLIVVDRVAQKGPAATLTDDAIVLRTLIIPMAHGIHARPAARIAACARDFDAAVALIHGDRRADAASAIALLSLNARHGTEISVEARGPDAEAAVAAITALIASGMGENTHIPAPYAPIRPVRSLPEGQLAGITAAPGIAAGPAARFVVTEIEVPRDGENPSVEIAALDTAITAVRQRIEHGMTNGDAVGGAIMAAHLAFLDDATLRTAAGRFIESGRSAGHAWRAAIRAQAALLTDAGDPRFVERIDDLIDIERQVLAALTGTAPPAPTITAGAILVARDLLPSQLIGLDVAQVAGLCLERGGPTSHVAILAASMGLPALVAIGDPLGAIADGTPLVIDADDGRLLVDPDAALRDRYAGRIAERVAQREAALAQAHAACRTADGARIELFANLGSIADARIAAEHGAEGSGLVRTEFLFLDRDAAPGEEEQAAQYQSIADALPGRPVIVRLLDIGGDKPAPYLPIPPEENPALGLRGIRVGLDRPALLATQLRAILRTQPAGQCRIMVPMVASLAELRAVRQIAQGIADELSLDQPPSIGVMIETPAAAVTADLLAAEADFLSIGTNDLTQYTLAMDRGNQAVAGQVDALHPAVLRLIAQTCTGARASGRPVGVCGGAASDAAAIPILIGLGVSELSVTPRFVPEAKAIVRRVSLARCRDHATRALALSSPAEVRALASAFLREEMP